MFQNAPLGFRCAACNKADRGIFYAYYGNTAINLDSLPVSHACLTVVEPALFE